MYKKTILFSFIVILSISLGLFLYFSSGETVSNEGENNENYRFVETVDSTKNDSNKNYSDSPFSKYITMESADDQFFQTHIHWMSHQKVESDDKWGYEIITDEKIDWLLKSLDKADLKHEDVYRSILERWNDDDFSQVDKDHNEIWKLQGGYVGEATRVLSDKEERELLEKLDGEDCYNCKQ